MKGMVTKKGSRFGRLYFIGMLALSIITVTPNAWGKTPSQYNALPIVGATSEPPLVMLVLGRNHKLYYEAYNDASDLNEDGELDVGYNPGIDYYGYFDSYKVYTYDSYDQRFEPLRETTDKKVDPNAANEWSGDYLNYLTMSRMDAIRKVLFGGYRSTDTATETVLERAYIPRDAHTWGKEYKSVERDGYDIQEYTPLDLPTESTYHLFASTSLYDASDTNYRPLLRVLPNNTHRIWDWVSIESGNGIAGDLLENNDSTTYASLHPSTHSEFQALVDDWAISDTKQGSSSADQIDGGGNPNATDQDYYLTIFSGRLQIDTAGTYYFAVDGDDAVEVLVDGSVVAGYYDGHSRCNCTSHSGKVDLTAGSHTIEFRHEEAGGNDYYHLHWNGPDSEDKWEIVPKEAFSSLTQTNYSLKKTTGSSLITDYVVRVQVGVDSMPEESCKIYTNDTTGDTVYKPVGLLQRYGESQQMYFGLLTGSYAKNTSGGVLRKNIGDIQDEIDPDTGQFTSVNGIIDNINRLRVVGLGYNGTSTAGSYSNCGWITTRAINEGECEMWGNPISEMMYETLRYFSGKASPTIEYTYSSSTYDDGLGLAKPTWEDPYATYPYCSKPFMLVISDINPTYDSDQLPGSHFGSFSGDLADMDVATLADAIGTLEGTLGEYYIGAVGASEDGACSSKSVDGLGDVRGLCPEEPTKKGSYYSSSVAYYGHTTDISSVIGTQEVATFAVGLASPLPKLEIPVGDGLITLVPFAKSVEGDGISATEGDFQPTNTIVDFYVETIEDTHGKFRINFEDVEQGADHDMDAVILYEYQVVDAANNSVDDPADGVAVKISLTSEYAYGGITQHCGYIISGTTQDGTYLEVLDQRDGDNAGDTDYYLDTPPGELPGNNAWNDGAPLPFYAERTFTPIGSGTTPAALLENPLWYAGKWGGFEDRNGNDIPDLDSEWDNDGDGLPDNYFYVTNPLRLEEQLNASFAMIAASTASGTSSSVVASTVEGEATLYQAYFRPILNTDSGDELTWIGYLQSLWLDSDNNIREDTVADGALKPDDDRVIVFSHENGQTVVHAYEEAYPDIENDTYSTLPLDDLTPIWEAGSILAKTDAADRNIFTYPTGSGSDLVEFGSASNFDTLKYYLGVSDADITTFPDANIKLLGDTLDERAENLISYIRGNDITGLRPRTLDGNVWKLGDIIYSTPVAVSGAVESYDSVYSDPYYGEYVSAQKNRQTMVYVGANDGMLHAFTAGVFNSDDMKFEKATENMVNGQGDIGDEMWAYIPKAVLPHLKWLADPDYDHTYYVDLMPKIFDAKIAGTNQDQWGTFLLLGLNMGGKDIYVDADGNGSVDTEPIKPTYTLLDITDPTNPKFMWEKDYEGLGMSASVPSIIKIGGPYYDSEAGEAGEWKNTDVDVNGQWLAVFGSGPQGVEAYAGKSDKPGRLYVIDLRTGEAYDPNGSVNNDYLFTTSDNAVINSPQNVDHNMTYEVNAVYFGESIDSGTNTIGKVWSFDTYDRNDPEFQDTDYTPLSWSVDEDPEDWQLHLVMETLPSGDKLGPVSAPINISTDSDDNIWLYFGTGKYVSANDRTNSDQQHLFGLKDPLFNRARAYKSAEYKSSTGDTDQALDFSITTGGGLLASDNYRVYANPAYIDETVEVYESGSWQVLGTFNDLLYLVRWDPDDKDDEDDGDADSDGDVDSQWLDGWFRKMVTSGSDPSERCLNDVSVLGGGVYATGYTPSEEECSLEGVSSLYGLYYETGTAYTLPLISTGDDEDEPITTRITTTSGKTAPPTFTPDGNKLISQSSTGEVDGRDVDTPFDYMSRITNWFD